MITVELFGVPRLRAGRRCVTLRALTLGSALEDLARVCPALEGSVILGQTLHPAYRLCLNEGAFVSDPATRFAEGDVLLLMAADAGG